MRLEFPEMIQRETVNKGQEPRSQTAITFFADTRLDELETHRLRAAATVFEMHLRERAARGAWRHLLGRRRLL